MRSIDPYVPDKATSESSFLIGALQVCRSLFEKDKLLFAFLMTVHLKAHIQHSLDWACLRFLLTGWQRTFQQAYYATCQAEYLAELPNHILVLCFPAL